MERDFEADLQDLLTSAVEDRKRRSQTASASQKKPYLATSQKSQVKKENAAFRSSMQGAPTDLDESWLLSDDQLEAEISN